MNNEENPNDFLKNFFKENNMFSGETLENEPDFQNKEKQAVSSYPQKNPEKIKKLSLSQKDINLKKLFQNIQEEKEAYKKRIHQEIHHEETKKKYIPTVAMIKLQSEFRLLFEDFLKILPLMERTERLIEQEKIEPRFSRNTEAYFPELWEDEGSIIFKKFQNSPSQWGEEDVFSEEKIKPFYQKEDLLEIPNPILNPEISQEPEEQENNSLEDDESDEIEMLLEEYRADIKPRSFSSQKKTHISSAKSTIKSATESLQSSSKKIFFAAEAKFQKGKNSVLQKISEISRPNDSFFTARTEKIQQKKSIEKAIVHQKKRIAYKKESGILEGIKIMSTVAGLFLFAMVGLNYPSLMEVTEKYWNAEEYQAKQKSLKKFVEKNNISTANKFSNIPTLPVAGPKAKKIKDFDTKMYLNISPPDTRIVIPSLGKNIPILDVADDSREKEDWKKLENDIQEALRDGVVHYPGTANPGQGGNVFITGHSSYYPWDDGEYKDVFAALHDLHEGDEYYIYHKGKKYKYRISTRKVVSPGDVSVLEQDTSRKTSTLMTCTPIGTAARRLILQAEQVEVGY